MESNNYSSVRMGNYDINLQPSNTEEIEYNIPNMIKQYKIEGAGGAGGGVLTAPKFNPK